MTIVDRFQELEVTAELGDLFVAGTSSLGFDVWHRPSNLRVPAGLPGRTLIYPGATWVGDRGDWQRRYWFPSKTAARKYMLAVAASGVLGSEPADKETVQKFKEWLTIVSCA